MMITGKSLKKVQKEILIRVQVKKKLPAKKLSKPLL